MHCQISRGEGGDRLRECYKMDPGPNINFSFTLKVSFGITVLFRICHVLRILHHFWECYKTATNNDKINVRALEISWWALGFFRGYSLFHILQRAATAVSGETIENEYRSSRACRVANTCHVSVLQDIFIYTVYMS